MEKLQYVVWLPPETTRAEVRTRFVDELAPKLLAIGIHGLTMDLDADEADVPAPVPTPEGEDAPHAIVSVWVDCYDRRGPLEDLIGDVAVRFDGYQAAPADSKPDTASSENSSSN